MHILKKIEVERKLGNSSFGEKEYIYIYIYDKTFQLDQAIGLTLIRFSKFEGLYIYDKIFQLDQAIGLTQNMRSHSNLHVADDFKKIYSNCNLYLFKNLRNYNRYWINIYTLNDSTYIF